ncbi:MAG TPA: IS66 family insertion sequence element accessory protein TnpB [Thermoanaerobaculia bacterium]|nr:IS66 family insertion sequence element accessory protein TnpB [Thermoanaerobaculia bacterium]
MLTLPLSTRVLVCREPLDMRRSFDGLEAAVRERLQENPLSGALFVFWNRRRDRLKILSFDGTGLWIWYKRLESGRFELPGQPGDSPEISSADLLMVLEGIEFASARRRRRWRRGTGQEKGFYDRNQSYHGPRSEQASRRPGAAARRDLTAAGGG